MDCIDAIMTRRSIRAYSPEAVTDAELDTILRAAMAAPSAGNEHPWRFVVVREPEARARLAKATPFAKALESAPVGIVVCADKRVLKYPGFWPVDCSAAIENALLAAHALGLGGLWMGVHPIPVLVANVRRIIRAPRYIVPMSLVAIGHAAAPREPVDRYDDEFVRYESWKGGEAAAADSDEETAESAAP